MTDLKKNLLGFLPLSFIILSFVMLAFLIADLVLWGIVTGVVLFLFSSGIMIVLQLLGRIKLWDTPYLIVIPPVCIFIGAGLQSYNMLAITPSPTVATTQLTLAYGLPIALGTFGVSIGVGVIIAVLLKKR